MIVIACIYRVIVILYFLLKEVGDGRKRPLPMRKYFDRLPTNRGNVYCAATASPRNRIGIDTRLKTSYQAHKHGNKPCICYS